MISKKEWFTIEELFKLKLPGLTKSKVTIHRQANKDNWTKRQKKGMKGIAYEYHISSFPIQTRLHLGYIGNSNQIQEAQKIIDYDNANCTHKNEELNLKKNQDTTLLSKWIDIFNIMNEFEQLAAINNIMTNGYKQLLVNPPQKLSNIKQAIINLLLELNDEEAREMLFNIGKRNIVHQPTQKQA